MRSPAGPAACAVLLLLPATLVLGSHDDTGYFVEEAFHDDVLDVTDSHSDCPTDKLLRTWQTCNVNGVDIQCIRLQCCSSHNFIAGRCIPKSVEPCSLKLCEQACEVRGDQMRCSCYAGYRFNADNFIKRTQPYCVDIDECATNNGGCDHRCVNDPGGYRCTCDPHLILAADGRRCERPTPVTVPAPLPLIRASSRCYASCDTVSWLTRSVRSLTEQLRATQAQLKKISDSLTEEDGTTNSYKVLDSVAPMEGGYCRCERGPRGEENEARNLKKEKKGKVKLKKEKEEKLSLEKEEGRIFDLTKEKKGKVKLKFKLTRLGPAGPPGAEGPKGDEGARGPRGPRGPEGSLDLMLLLLADMRHDINNLEQRVYKNGDKCSGCGRGPERFNLQKAWSHQRKQEKLETERNTEQALEAYTAPPYEATEDHVQITPNAQDSSKCDTTRNCSTQEQLLQEKTWSQCKKARLQNDLDNAIEYESTEDYAEISSNAQESNNNHDTKTRTSRSEQSKQQNANHQSEEDWLENELNSSSEYGSMDDSVEISSTGQTGTIPHESTTDYSLVKGETTSRGIPRLDDLKLMDEKLRQFYILANTTSPGDEEIEDLDDTEYNNY